VICNLYVQVVQPLQSVADVCRHYFRVLVLPGELDALSRARLRNSPLRSIHILDFIQVVLLWVVIYFFFLYMPNHESSGSPFQRTWVHATWVGSLMYDGAMASVFLLRARFYQFPLWSARSSADSASFSSLPVSATSTTTTWVGTLQTGSWYEAIWTALNIIPIVIVGTWDPEKIENTNVRPLL